LLNELENSNGTNNLSLDFDIQRYVDVDIIDSNLYKQEFGMKDAIPISLNLESFIFIKPRCIHNILHSFNLPIKTEIKWKIKGGIDNGAFKIGNGMDAEFFPRDSSDSVIFYPNLQNNKNKNQSYKKICIELTVKQLGSSIFKEQEYNFFVNIHILILRKFAKRNYRIKMFVSKLEDQDNNNNNNNKIDNYISKHNIVNTDPLKSSTITTKTEKKENEKEADDGKYQISFKSIHSCKTCNLSVILKTNKLKTSTNNLFSISALKSYLITSDIIKISAGESNSPKYSIKNNDNSSIILTGSNYKKYFINGIQIQPRLFWKSTIGELVYGNLGQSLIYYTPGESDLSKSPITMNLYFQYYHNLDDIQQAILSDSKKLWILRQPPLMGG
jgi:hypothetical protein